MKDIETLERSSKRSAIISLIGIVIFVFSLLYSSYNLNKADQMLRETRRKLNVTKDSLDKVEMKVSALTRDEAAINEYILGLIESTRRNQGHRGLAKDQAKWDTIRKSILSLPSGRRKIAVNIALLTTWKVIPFQLSVNQIKHSFDSPGYIQYVLGEAGIPVTTNINEPLSVTLMNKFKKVNNPLPGDLMFYKGQVGNFGLICLAPGIGIGTLQASAPLSIYETKYMNTDYFPFIGYFRVIY